MRASPGWSRGGYLLEARAGWELLGGAFVGLAARSWNTDLPLWGGVALPLAPAFWEGVPPEGAGFLALVLLRLRVYLEPPGF